GLRDYQDNYIACLSVNNMVRRKLNNKNMQFTLCFFGEHLLAQHPNKVVGVVESEKTAVLLSIFIPGMVWLATGGASGCRWTEYQVHKVLQDRTVTFYPDYGYYNRTTQTTCYQEWSRRVQHIQRHMPARLTVSNTLETNLAALPREDQDLADVMVRGGGS
ncbi:MAG TPA: DUF6371 domain-containing protein, partial [Chitinophagaceae bacterium]|nr:DUF6371 domain-containing protein [Chitinophagaceae bacterium]